MLAVRGSDYEEKGDRGSESRFGILFQCAQDMCYDSTNMTNTLTFVVGETVGLVGAGVGEKQA